MISTGMSQFLFFVPGYSDEDFSFVPLKNLLVREGLYEEKNIKSIEYASMDNEVDFSDFADRLDDVYEGFCRDQGGNGLRIDILAHSTGSLVARAWLLLRRRRQRVRGMPLDIPVEHLFLFAPANFGSDLAVIGRSGLNKARVTFTKFFASEKFIPGNDDLFETGKKVLEGLEPASPTQWQLSIGDLHDETYFGPADESGLACYPFIFAAGRPEQSRTFRNHFVRQLRQDGTDNTIRVAGTGLNTRLLTLRAHKDHKVEIAWDNEQILNRDQMILPRKFHNIPLAIYSRYDHCGIINDNYAFPKPKDSDSRATWNPVISGNTWEPLAQLKAAKNVIDDNDYSRAADEFQRIYDEYIDYCRLNGRGIYQQFFFHAIDDTGQSIQDFDLSFIVRRRQSADTDVLAEGLTEELQDILDEKYCLHPHTRDPSYKVLMLGNIDKVSGFLQEKINHDLEVVMVISAQGPYNGVHIAEAEFPVYRPSFGDLKPAFFFPFTTTLVLIVLDRHISSEILRKGDFSFG